MNKQYQIKYPQFIDSQDHKAVNVFYLIQTPMVSSQKPAHSSNY